jgi:hypothetical protein
VEFLVEFDVTIPGGTLESEVKERLGAEASAAAGVDRKGHRSRLVAPGQSNAVGVSIRHGGADVLETSVVG